MVSPLYLKSSCRLDGTSGRRSRHEPQCRQLDDRWQAATLQRYREADSEAHMVVLLHFGQVSEVHMRLSKATRLDIHRQVIRCVAWQDNYLPRK